MTSPHSSVGGGMSVFRKMFCRIGLHDWKLSNGKGYTVGNSRMTIFYSKDCRRCGKHEDAVMVV